MTDVITELCKTVSGQQADALAIARTLGAVGTDSGEGLPLEVKPGREGLAAASGAREPDGQVAHVTLTPSPGAAPTVAVLRKAFGAYREAPLADWNRPQELVFERDMSPGRPFACTLIVAVEAEGTVEDGRILSLTVRRDIRL